MRRINARLFSPDGLWLGVVVALMAIAGCSNGPRIVEAELPETKARLMEIARAYSDFTMKNRRPPQNVAELKQSLTSENPDETLNSPRDGQPFVICYDVNLNNVDWASSGTEPVMVYEREGEDGRRWVVCPPGMILEMNDETFRSASFPPGHKLLN